MAVNSADRPSIAVSGRRSFLRLAAGALTACAAGQRALASLPARELGFLNLHTGERLRVPYWENGSYIPEALSGIYHVLRDHRANIEHVIDTRLLDLLAQLQSVVGRVASFEVISGYRAPATNALLRSRSTGVAQTSMHLLGKAVDIRLPGCDLGRLHRAAVGLRGGGVGLYRSSNFIHVDTGRVRYW